MTVINTNAKSIFAQNALTINNRSMGKAMEQLSTGKRINNAGDDAAGLAIASKMTAQIRGLNQAVRNANDAISMIQTAEGATVEITNMLQRMRELSVQAANDTYSGDDRAALNDEFAQLSSEIQRIATKTQWNGFNVLDGSAGTAGVLKFQVGAKASDTIDIEIANFKIGAVASSPSIQQVNLQTTVPDGAATPAPMGLAAVDQAVITLGGGTPFTVALAAADIATPTALKTKLTTAIQSVSGFENVQVEAGSNTLTITDEQARTVSIKLQGLNNATTPAMTDIILSTQESGGSIGAGDLNGLVGQTITSQSLANTAVDAVDSALEVVNAARSEMGAIINRLTYAADNLMNVSMNTSSSRSRIEDADYATQSAELARTQIISQAATAMLAQANQQPQAVLQLLQG